MQRVRLIRALASQAFRTGSAFQRPVTHVSFFRKSDGVLIAGDAILTVNLNSLWDLLLNRHRVSGPLYISTWNWQIAKESVAVLATLEPRVLACGHGIAMIGSGTAYELRAFSDRF